MDAAKEEFLKESSLAIVGISGKKCFGNDIFRELLTKGYRLFPVGRNATTIEGQTCYKSLDELPEKVGGVLIVVSKAEAVKLVGDCARLGLKRVWLQKGSGSKEAAALAEEKGISVVNNKCILMYARPVGVHKFHAAINKLFGMY